ncbi:hypothetical protein [Rhizobium sullae]|uniref:hypothetical protein n=1 Tax=Rhizobium sullae TaxID=50338 RepID=UPI000B35CF93|nr:hypothetical protein [Rhizobium sullae]
MIFVFNRLFLKQPEILCRATKNHKKAALDERKAEKQDTGSHLDHAQFSRKFSLKIAYFCIKRAFVAQPFATPGHLHGKKGRDWQKVPLHSASRKKMQFWYAKDIYFDMVQNGKIN